MGSATHTALNTAQSQAIASAKQEIIELRSLYAYATDLIASSDTGHQAKGREIYHRIYTPDAQISAQGIDPVVGPDAWVKVVADALESYDATQHLVGSPLVHQLQLPDEQGNGGKAEVTAYLQAWHSTPENSLYMFVGTYHDRCVYSPKNGWQIAAMRLQKTADELRDFTPR